MIKELDESGLHFLMKKIMTNLKTITKKSKFQVGHEIWKGKFFYFLFLGRTKKKTMNPHFNIAMNLNQRIIKL